ncbi:hypothetical protein CAPTEDRAFT_121679 [Capitella teleta]|uniref:Major facilitator superfamily (MFS) profile domain-containing protein n=1 Tax=Capitella teleta TaxID=283909 RepID=R7V075_CAPTE|nr:hypothetical protein CAPTEDRAFT_121679 [Capitella teleta]|eukprot:ELU09061.1 hypothetical protein CAPTEDRAFT_121679 [Capitella teleta]
MDIEDIYDLVGNMGLYQWCAFFVIGCFAVFAVDSIAMNFVGAEPDHWCHVEELSNLSYDQQKYIAIPFTDDSDDEFQRCKMFNLDYHKYDPEDFVNWNRTDMVNENTPLTDCGRGWVYDQSEFISTITGKLDLVCDDQWMVSMISTCYMAGILVGAVGSGYLSDKFGRKKTIYVSILLKVATTLMTTFPINYPWVAVTRFLLGVGSTGAYLTGFILIMELIGNKWRGALGVSYQQQFAIGFMLWPAVAYFIRDDIKVQLAMSGPVIILLVFWWLIDESPRWLLVKERYEDAEVVLRKIAAINGRELPDDFDIGMIRKVTPRLRLRTLIVDFHWFVLPYNFHFDMFQTFQLHRFTDSLMYYALSLNTGSLPGGVFFTTFLAGAVEVPANLIAVFFMGWRFTGRRLTCSLSMLIAGGASLIQIYTILENVETAQTVLAMVSKGFVTVGFSGIYVFTSELFPTEVRNVGVGSASMCARVGGMIAPYMGPSLEGVWKPLPSVLTGGLAILAGLLTLLLPETLDQPLFSTVEEAEAFGRYKSSTFFLP